jgi:hypothetical protein
VVKIHGHAVLGDVQVFHSNPRAIRRQRRRSIETEPQIAGAHPATSHRP